MDEEIIKNNEDEQEVVEQPKPPRAETRNKDLAEKVELTARERDEAQAQAQAAQKELDFYKGFSKVSSKYQNAGDFEDKIKEKVLSGYEMEDAAISVLTKAGKFNPGQVQRESPAGGSAVNARADGGEKTVMEMSLAEKREALMQLDKENPGDLAKTLRSINL